MLQVLSLSWHILCQLGSEMWPFKRWGISSEFSPHSPGGEKPVEVSGLSLGATNLIITPALSDLLRPQPSAEFKQDTLSAAGKHFEIGLADL